MPYFLTVNGGSCSIDRVPKLGSKAAHVKRDLQCKLLERHAYVREYGQDMPEIREWKWKDKTAGKNAPTGFRGKGDGESKERQ